MSINGILSMLVTGVFYTVVVVFLLKRVISSKNQY